MLSTLEREGIAKMNIWNADAPCGIFYAFVTCLLHLCGRSCEIAGIRKSRMITIPDQMNNLDYNILGLCVERNKVHEPAKNLNVYPHRDNMLFCAYFSIGYALVMSRGQVDSDFLFPEFEKKLRGKNDKDIDSSTASLFKHYADQLIKGSVKYGDSVGIDNGDSNENHEVYLPKKFVGHGFKKSAVNILGECLEFHVFVFRCGWMVKNMHTAFDYLFNSAKKDRVCGKVLAGWSTCSDGSVHGGYPPSHLAIKNKRDKFEDFVRALFYHEHYVRDGVKLIIAASLLRFLKDFEHLITRVPDGKFENKHDHPYVARIYQAAKDTDLTETDLIGWCEDINEDFIKKNFRAYLLKRSRKHMMMGASHLFWWTLVVSLILFKMCPRQQVLTLLL